MTTPPTSAAEPTSAAAVAALPTVAAEADDEELVGTVAAVNRYVRRILDPRPDGSWDPDHALGAKMLASRLWRRRNSPEGVATFTSDTTVYVRRNDPDVAMLLAPPPVAG